MFATHTHVIPLTRMSFLASPTQTHVIDIR